MSITGFAACLVGLGAFITLLSIIFKVLCKIEHPAYVEYSVDNNNQQQASVNIWTSRYHRSNGYVNYNFIHKDGKWKSDGELKVFLCLLIIGAVLFVMEIILIVIADIGVEGVFPAFLFALAFMSLMSAGPLADIILACSVLDDDLREKRNKNI